MLVVVYAKMRIPHIDIRVEGITSVQSLRLKSQLLRKVVGGLGILGIITAAMVGLPSTAHAGDGRAATVDGEIVAQYVHSLDRRPSQQELDHYAHWPRTDKCSWGLQDASFKIANSAEAQNRWRYNPEDLAGMLFASLLDRAPSPAEVASYANAIRTRGLGWTTAATMATGEYFHRIARICGKGDVGRASMFGPEPSLAFAENTLIDLSLKVGVTCGVIKKLQKFMGFKKDYKNARALLLSINGEITNRIYNRLVDPCKAAVSYLRAAIQIMVVAGEGKDNPVFIQWDSHKRGPISYFTLRIGPNPTSWEPFSGKINGF